MEAAVLKPRMMADARAEREVQKLQELVRKLERQNEQLRARANNVPPSPACLRATSRCIPSPAPSLACQYFPPDDPFPYFQPHSAADDEDDEDEEDELMLLELESVSPSGDSDETWLYESPRSHLRSGAGLDALQWTRHVLDQLRPELDAGRHSLGQRLESVSRWRSGFSSPALPRARVVGVSPLCTSSPSSKPCAPLPSGTSCERAGRRVRRGVDGDVSASEPDHDSVTLGYRLQDLTDVQVMARLQEESLRQDYASSSSSSSSSSVNRRSASFSFQFGQRGDLHLNEEEEDDDEDYGQLPPPQPRLSRAGALPHSQTFSSIRDWTHSSTPRSSAAPQTQTQTQTGLRSSSDKLRRSMPNLLVSAALSPVSSSPALRSSQSFESSGALTLTRLQSSIPAPAPLQNRVQSLGSFSSRQPLKATAYVSPTIKSSSVSLQSLSVSEIPKAPASQILSRSGLPRPASFIASGSSPRGRLSAPVRRADYWKSQPRKFCQYCKCWIADNKPSIEFHERGKNHKGNVAAKISEIKKKSVAKAKQEQKMSKQFAAMEEAAQKAYEEDLKRLAGESVAPSEAPVKKQKKPKKQSASVPSESSGGVRPDVWLRGTTNNGLLYYYNTVTGESSWEKPDDFSSEDVAPPGVESPREETPAAEDLPPPQPESVSGAEDTSDPPKDTPEPDQTEQTSVSKISFTKRKEEPVQASADDGGERSSDDGGNGEEKREDSAVTDTVKKDETPVKRPRKTNPYGAWEQIQLQEDPYEKVDLQLPQVESVAQTAVDVPQEPRARFRERTITSLGAESSAGATFKKRKTENGKSRSPRQRETDE